MANPTPYEVSFNFEGFQATNPSSPLPALSLDNEFFNIELTLSETIQALADVRASDGTLRQGSVSVASLEPGLLTGIAKPSLWATATVYAEDSTVFFGPKFYIAKVDHTSGVFATDLAAAKWSELADFTPAGIVAAATVTYSGVAAGLAATHVQAAIDELAGDLAAGDAALIPKARLAADVLPFLTPVGAVVPFAGTAAPAGWLLCGGQEVSRTTYAALFAALGTTYGVGDGLTTFALPDMQGRVVAGKDNMSGTSADRLTNQSGGVNGDVLGAAGGGQTHTLTTSQLPGHTHTGTTVSAGNHGHPFRASTTIGGDSDNTGGFMLNEADDTNYPANSGSVGATPGDQIGGAGAHTHTFTTASAGSNAAHNNVQPTIILNYIIFAGV